MKPSNLQVHIRAEFLDAQGKVIKRTRWKRARSYVQQFIDHLGVCMGFATLNIADTGGTPRSIGPHATLMRVDAEAALTTSGIVIGIGTDNVEIANHKLGDQVTTNIAHSSTTVSAPTTNGKTRLFEIVRTFTNNTVATLNIKEVGLYGRSGAGNTKHCIDRSLYDVTINNGASVSLRYRIKVTV